MNGLIVMLGWISGVGILMLTPGMVWAHCDTMDGPVVVTARLALERGDVIPVLKWVKKEHEEEIRAAFQKTQSVRSKGADARELADMYFFETVVRVHRAGEGAPYTGLKPAGTDPGPVVTASDKALDSDSVESLVKMVTDAVADGIRARFLKASEARKHADHNVMAGREYVESYVQFVHYVERLYNSAVTRLDHHAEAGTAEHKHSEHE